jgi:hypothetical protein
MLPLVIDDKEWMEDLHRGMGIHAGGNPGDQMQVAVDEFAQSAVVIDRAQPRTACDEQLKAWDAEGVLHVDHNQGNLELIFRSG